MEEINNISAEELFGVASRLVESGDAGAYMGLTSLGSMYQVATALVALLFIFISVRYFDLFRYLIASMVSKKVDRSNLHSFAADIRNVEIVTSLAGFSLIALLAMRLMVMTEFRSLFAPLGAMEAWEIGIYTFVAIGAIVLLERGMLYLIGIVSECSGACNDIWHIKLLHFTTAIIAISPLLIFALLTEGLATRIALYTSVAICSLSLILFIKETFSLFRAQRFSIFHWILYLCALEIFPLSLLVAPIMRGGV